MKYLCLAYHEDEKLRALSQAEMDTLVAGCLGWVGELEKSGQHILSAGLQSVRTAATVRSRGGKVSVTDGPFAETKEYLGGFILIEARDLNEAIHLASTFPGANIGSVEVRPVLEADGDPADPLDQKTAAAFRRSATALEAGAASRMATLPQNAPQRA